MTSPAVVLRTCADLLSSVPYLLGFHPADSVVVVALRGGRVRFAARGDLPGSAPGVPPPGAVAARFVALLARERADAVALIGYGAPALVTPALDALRSALAGTRIAELDVLRVEGGRYWSYVCPEPSCCPPSGVPFDPAAPAAVAAVVAGHVALPDRASVVRAVAPVSGPARASMRAATERAWRRLDDLLDGRVGRVPFAAFTATSDGTPTPAAADGGRPVVDSSTAVGPAAPGEAVDAAASGLDVASGAVGSGSATDTIGRDADPGGVVAAPASGVDVASGAAGGGSPAVAGPCRGSGSPVGDGGPPVGAVAVGAPARAGLPLPEDGSGAVRGGAPTREVVGRRASRPARVRSAHPAMGARQRRLLLAAGRAAVAEAFARHGAGRALPDDDVAWLSVLLTHVPVRDHAWEHTDDDERHVALWSDVVRRVEPVLAAAPAGLLAFAAWRAGHGALAGAAVDRALSADPEYPMALLMEEVLDQCVAPSSWGGRPPARARRRRRGRGRGEREKP